MQSLLYEKAKRIVNVCNHTKTIVDHEIERRARGGARWFRARTASWNIFKKVALLSLIGLLIMGCYAFVLVKTIEWENLKVRMKNRQEHVEKGRSEPAKDHPEAFRMQPTAMNGEEAGKAR